MKRKAFTLMELLIAAAIFTILALGVFSLFSMGSRMYICGSWKYNKQKEGERFLQTLKERIEQTSKPAYIQHIGDKFVLKTSQDTAFFVNSAGNVNCTAAGFSETEVADFVVAKTDTSQSEAASTTTGLVLYHRLYVEPQPNGLGKLCLYADTNSSSFPTRNFGSYNFPPTNPDSHAFGTNSNPFSFPNGAHSYSLDDVASITFNGIFYASQTAALTTELERNPVFMLTVTMRNQKYPDTTLELRMRARIHPSIKFAEF